MDQEFLDLSVRLAVENVAAGGGPFGAVVVRDGTVVATGQNRVTAQNDPTAHAEVQAIRAACAALGTFTLTGTTLYSSCEPCPMCLASSLWARVDRVVFAADRHDAARGGFDDRAFYELFDRPRAEWEVPVQQRRDVNSPAPFDAWLASAQRVDY
ncbi:nucleoside deaminase [Kineococcus rhizosphaerae]|uniref:Guanine deaminase n=1 Tax=Kineococcus rhizosphaerae TaxID=559628 RepID=A0A2T0R626_9ACTN|nr:nucleoside deaminase [Kineococcus rhizosphaerae]PRY16639.1 guanine deaminase [Kineococcus rhizosphaerae]